MDYLYDARIRLEKCSQACQQWQYPYDGDSPASTSLNIELADDVAMATDSVDSKLEGRSVSVGELNGATTAVTEEHVELESDKTVASNSITCDSNIDNKARYPDSAMLDLSHDISMEVDKSSVKARFVTDEEFIQILDESASPADKSVSIEDSIKNLDSVFSSVSTLISCTSTPRKDQSSVQAASSFGGEDEMSTVYYECESFCEQDNSDVFKSVNESSFEVIDGSDKSKTVNNNATEFDIIEFQQMEATNNNNKEVGGKSENITSFVDISTASRTASNDAGEIQALENMDTGDMVISDNHFSAEKKAASVPKMGILVSKGLPEDGQSKGDKSVRFSETAHMQSVTGLSTSRSLPVMGANTSFKSTAQPNIGKFVIFL